MPNTSHPEACAPLRADAARNRTKVIEAACEQFRQGGLDIPLEDVAKAAGVGIATLYRRFPTREELIAAVFEELFASYRPVLEDAVGQDDPWTGVVRLVNGLCALQAAGAGLGDLVALRFPSSPAMEQLRLHVESQLEGLLDRARASGQLRPDADLSDLMLIFLGNAEVVRRTAQHAPDAWQRYAALQLESLRARPDAAPLPAPLTAEQRVAVLKR
ncbi:TetR/AcrR family transcriptional regulator [Flexivirga sp. ID2601S]|uniref:TetR/AcrR family transcriptional regulator n=1 Tax=Flexivirga aerilata TaxID=1656889 RepID=A0A849AGL2_9MICO|nr:TetR/AcrR family transcriptional regulator [Flexivirga aerilata]NNG38411.1 TetR/AcrR family transcriptional regulator [Flexivirga aerilata]